MKRKDKKANNNKPFASEFDMSHVTYVVMSIQLIDRRIVITYQQQQHIITFIKGML